MNKPLAGFLLGIVAGIIDVIPMIIQKLSWDADLSAFLFWVVNGCLIATSNLKIPAPLKGIAISFLTLLPLAIIIGKTEPTSLIPISIMTLILGGGLGYGVEKASHHVTIQQN